MLGAGLKIVFCELHYSDSSILQKTNLCLQVNLVSMSKFKLKSKFAPAGDQPEAIKALIEGY